MFGQDLIKGLKVTPMKNELAIKFMATRKYFFIGQKCHFKIIPSILAHYKKFFASLLLFFMGDKSLLVF